MNDTIEGILGHYSVRKFKDKPLSKETIQQLVKCAQAASTSHFTQSYSIIGVSDLEIRGKLAEIAGNSPYVKTTGQFFVFVADLARNQKIAEAKGVDYTALESTEKMLVSVIDATLAAQNMAVAAESMGLGICFIGGLRNDLKAVIDLLDIPSYALPIFGLTIGYPEQDSVPKPRLPKELVYHENKYQVKTKEAYADYDQTICDYYNRRTGGARAGSWTEQIAAGVSHPTRPDINPILHNQNLAKE